MYSLTEEQVNERFLRIENELTRKMGNHIKKSEIYILKALKALSENSLRNDHNSPSAEVTSDGENSISVQSVSHGLDSDQENIDPNESVIGAELNRHDRRVARYIFCQYIGGITGLSGKLYTKQVFLLLSNTTEHRHFFRGIQMFAVLLWMFLEKSSASGRLHPSSPK